MKIWVSDDANKLPLLIESPLKIGSAKAVLKSYKGLRHKLSSKLQKNEMDCKVAAGIIADSRWPDSGTVLGQPGRYSKTEENTSVVVEKLKRWPS